MKSYVLWRKFLVNNAGDLRAVTMERAQRLYAQAIEHYDRPMIEALEPLAGGY